MFNENDPIMPYGLYISADGAQAQIQRLDVVANNLANVDTPGFKRDLAIMQARYTEANQQGLSSPGDGTINDLGGGVRLTETKTDFSPGPLKNTGGKSDIAIQGEGYFLVRKGDETLLTRAGNFRTTTGGDLVTQQGYAVLNDAHMPVIVRPDAGRWEVTASGGIQQGGEMQNLALVKPASNGDLVKVGENLFRPLADVQPVAPEQRNVATGFVEQSGVQPTTEMMNMIETSRLVEANVNMMKTQDQMLQGLIARVLKA